MIDINLGIGYNKNEKAILSNELELLIQQVDMMFNTDKYAVLGDMDYGTNYDQYLYTTGISNSALESKILFDLNRLNLFGFKPSVHVMLLEGSYRDIALIDITFTGEYETYNKTYRIN
jgi:hypothetical protein